MPEDQEDVAAFVTKNHFPQYGGDVQR